MKYHSKKLIAALALALPVSFANMVYAQGFKNQIPVPQADEQYDFVCKFPKTAPTPPSNLIGSDETSTTMRIQGKELSLRPIFNSPVSPPANDAASDRTKRKADLSSFRQFFKISSGDASNKELYNIAKELESTNQVEYCDFIQKNTQPPADIAPVSDDFTGHQSYVQSNPGIDVAYAKSLGLTGSNLTIADAESDFNLAHEDLEDQNVRFGNTRGPNRTHVEHGTAVVGILVAGDNGYGITGTVPDAEVIVFSEQFSRLESIYQAIEQLSTGDILLLEMQTGGPATPGSNIHSFVPADWNQSVWEAVKRATDAGIHVVATAGNGNVDLDNSLYDAYRARGDNGSIMVGAGTSTTQHNKLDFSTYGSTVHLQGWGENVTTLGEGDAAEFGNDPNQRYTHTFHGTSSAGPIVTSAVALVQDYAETYLNRDIDPREMRNLLINTGIAQGSGGNIGRFPNVRAAIEELAGDSSNGNDIVVRALGTTGGESITLKVNNIAIASWTLSTSFADYTATNVTTQGGITIEYTNNAEGGDVRIDYIAVGNTLRQSEDQSYNTGAWANDHCGGGSHTEWLHCDGEIAYGDNSIGGCNGINEYPNWTASDWSGGPYNHANTGDKMVYNSVLYEANWYTSTLPGSDASWTNLGACQ